jgi:signal transduction histidine kinase
MTSDVSASASDKKLHFLLVEDNSLDVELVRSELRRARFEYTCSVVQDAEGFAREVESTRPDVVITDYNLPQWRGSEVVNALRERNLDAPVILVTGALGETTAVECIKNGITDYVLKGSLARLPLAIRRALRDRELQRKKDAYLEELKRSNAELEQFAYIASHDLQEPLRMVASYTEILAERYRGKLDANADKYIGYAIDGAQRMQRLIRDLLAYARVSSQAKPLQPTDASAVLSAILRQLQGTIEQNKAEVVCGTLPSILADEVQLGQVFQNLINNAIKFRSEQPPRVEIGADLAEGRWRFSVRDNGIGMEMENAGRIFNMFQRLHTREKYEGTGIGLAISKRIVERHSGRIWCESEPGKGSTFYFTMPQVSEPQVSEEESFERARTSAAGRG